MQKKVENKFILGFVIFTTMLFGGGCIGSNQNNQVVNSGEQEPIQGTSEEEIAQQRRDRDSFSNLIPVAMVVLENQVTPKEEVERISDTTFGCGDKIGFALISREVATDDVVKDAVATLLAIRDSGVNGLYNSLWESSLEVEKVQSRDGVTTEVWLQGEVVSPGTCTFPRIKEQIEATIKQYRPNYAIYLNGSTENWRCLGDLSGQCGSN